MSIDRYLSKTKGWRYKAMVEYAPNKFMRSPTQDRRIDAERDERELIQARDSGLGNKMFVPLPFNSRIWVWHQDIVNRGCSFAHVETVRMQIDKHLLPFFGTRDIKGIKPSDISSFVAHMQTKKLSSVTINGTLTALRSFFAFEQEENNINQNPVKRKHRLPEIVKAKPIWTKAEAEKFLSYTDTKHQGDDRWVYLFYKIALNTGMRLGEIVALTKSDFDFENNRVIVSKAYCNFSNTIKLPKNNEVRYTPLSPQLASEMRDYFISHKVFGPLFMKPNGQYRSYISVRKRFLTNMKEAGVKRVCFHSMRRYFVSSYIQNGGNPSQLRKIVGHADAEMTNLYFTMGDNLGEIASIVNM